MIVRVEDSPFQAPEALLCTCISTSHANSTNTDGQELAEASVYMDDRVCPHRYELISHLKPLPRTPSLAQ